MDELPTVMIGGPVRDRAWILPAFLHNLFNLDYPKERITLCFLLNDSTDGSKAILENFLARKGRLYRRARLLEANFGAPPDSRERERRLAIFHTLAQARNAFLEALADEEYVFSIDSDVLPPPEALARLMALHKDVAAAWIWNDLDGRFPNFLRRAEHGYVHLQEFPDTPFRVDVTGACYLMRAQVARAARYAFHLQGEDVPFCEAVQAAGYEIWVEPRVFCLHMLSRDIYAAAQEARP